MTLSLKEAADYIGILPDVLHQWTWADTGPKQASSTKSFWFPTFTKESLDIWLRDNRPPEKPEGPKYRLGTKRISRQRQT